jgi:hypothetical protein
MKVALSKSMTVAQFDHGYWYAVELKAFALSLGLESAGKLRKDELEKAIRSFIRTGRVVSPTRRALTRTGAKDLERGLRLDLPIVNYTSNSETKAFIEREARKLVPGFRPVSGARYRLNRWREEQIAKGVRITYGALVRQYVVLCSSSKRFARIPHGRYINFVSDFLASEKNATHARAVAAWKELKALDVPKDYRSWVKARPAS